MQKHDFYVAGRMKNQDAILPVVASIRELGRTAYCFLEHTYTYEGQQGLLTDSETTTDYIADISTLPQEHPRVRRIFEQDLAALLSAKNFLMVLPAGNSTHTEAGIAYASGRGCYLLGVPEKTETLYGIFTERFPDQAALITWLTDQRGPF